MNNQQGRDSRSGPSQEPPFWNVWNFHSRKMSLTAGVEDSVFRKDKRCDSVHKYSRLTLKLIPSLY